METQKPAVVRMGLDLDGTLYEVTEEMQYGRIRALIYQKLAQEFSISEEEARNFFETFYNELKSGGKAIRKIAAHLQKPETKRKIVQEALNEANVTNLMQPDPGLVRIIKRLSSAREISIITGSNLALAIKKLEKIGFANPYKFFTSILADEHGQKSDGAIYRLWLSQTKVVPPENHFYVGDNDESDIAVPKSLGIQTCYINHSGKTCAHADFNISSIGELEKILRL